MPPLPLFRPLLTSNAPKHYTSRCSPRRCGYKEPEDKGFALAPFTNVRFDNKGIIIDCDSALAQGNYYFTKTDGKEIKVDYSFGYVKDKSGHLKINLHHFSLPYKPE